MSAAGRRHMGRVAALPCVLCRHIGIDGTPAEVHHLEEETGAAQRQSDFLTVPLCPRHHRVEYPESVHALKRRGLYERYKISELDLLAATLEMLEARS